MHKWLNYSKGQFFVLSAIVIISILYIISKWIRSTSMLDTSITAMNVAGFIMDDIVEKVNTTIEISPNCKELNYNLEELNKVISKTFGINRNIIFSYTVNCSEKNATVEVNITEKSKEATLFSNLTFFKKF